MTTLEYNGTTVRVPDNWDDITLGQYDTIFPEQPETPRDRVAFVARVCKVEEGLLLDWPAEIFERIIGLLGFLFEANPARPNPCVTIEGVEYLVSTEDKLTLGEWVDIEEAQKSGDRVLSEILAIVCRPLDEAYDCDRTEERRVLYAAQPVSTFLGVLAFFLQCKNAFEKRAASYSKLAQGIGLLARNTKPLRGLGFGIKLFRIWPIIRYLILIGLLRFRLRRCLRTCNTGKTKTTQKRPSVS